MIQNLRLRGRVTVDELKLIRDGWLRPGRVPLRPGERETELVRLYLASLRGPITREQECRELHYSLFAVVPPSEERPRE